ncbi:MAG TPA: methyltransferase domain-containing protein [Acidimicrobiales bacterium]|nr:methyltransferase domain-containing protein [Acidimicrobiales bacterium]
MPADDASDAVPDVDALVDVVRRRVEERRAAGDYPDGLEARLDAHFERVAARRPEPYDAGRLRARLGAVDESLAFDAARITAESGVPGGAALHRAVAKAVSRQTSGVLEQVSEFARAVREALYELAKAVEHPFGHRHPDLLGAVDEALDRLAGMERSLAAGETVDRSSEAARFAARQRAGRPGRDEWLRQLAARFTGGPVADLASNDGALLSVLRASGVDAFGVEPEGALAEATRAAAPGAEVHVADPVVWLRGTAAGSLGGISALAYVATLDAGSLGHLLRGAARALRPGGVLVLEAPNPASLDALLVDVPLDPLATRAVHPAYLSALAAAAGFAGVELMWSVTSAATAAAVPAGALPEPLLDALVAPREYALVAIR